MDVDNDITLVLAMKAEHCHLQSIYLLTKAWLFVLEYTAAAYLVLCDVESFEQCT